MDKRPYDQKGLDPSAVLKEWARAYAKVSKSISVIFLQQQTWVQAINTAFKRIDFTAFRQMQEQLAQGFQSLARSIQDLPDRFAADMLSLGWPAPTDFKLNDIIAFEDMLSEGLEVARARIDGLMLGRYTPEVLNSLLDRWGKKRWLRKRIHILRDAVEAHIAGKYRLSVPTLLPQVEGIISDGFAHRGKMSGARLERYLDRLLKRDRPTAYGTPIKDFMLQCVLVQFEHGAPLSSSLSRHAILHGADTDYGTETNSLKLILLFDYLQDAFRLIATPAGRHYHLVGCPRLARSTAEIVVFKSAAEAQRSKRYPCKYCFKFKEHNAGQI